jgi:endonuclease-3
VDTHILRVSNRLGIVDTKSPDKCEAGLKEYFLGYDMAKLHHLLLLFGRYHCKARNPECDGCVLASICKNKN